jgi:hypothetical protein
MLKKKKMQESFKAAVELFYEGWHADSIDKKEFVIKNELSGEVKTISEVAWYILDAFYYGINIYVKVLNGQVKEHAKNE